MDVEEADRVLQDLWDVDVKAWNEYWVPVFRRFARDLVTDAHISRGDFVLDVGTGTGVAAIEAAKRTRSKGIVVGIDRSEPMLDLAKVAGANIENVSFLRMGAEHMTFPDGYFDAAISNSGMSYATFHETVVEIFRVIRKGGSFTFSDWHLIDVPAHRVFSDILRKHRTQQPSEEIGRCRAAVAMLEHVGNRYSDLKVQAGELEGVGFRNMNVRPRDYRIWLSGIGGYLEMRFEREAVRQELNELSKTQRAAFMKDLRAGLSSFVRNDRFMLDWKVTFTNVTKPS